MNIKVFIRDKAYYQGYAEMSTFKYFVWFHIHSISFYNITN